MSMFGTAPAPFWHPEAQQRQAAGQTITCGECGKVTHLTAYDVYTGKGPEHFAVCSQWVPVYTAGMVRNVETCSQPKCIKPATGDVVVWHGVEGLQEKDIKLGFCGDHGGPSEPEYQPEGYNTYHRPTPHQAGGRVALTIEGSSDAH